VGITVALTSKTLAGERTFGGYPCRNFCDVHADGYKWARNRNIRDKQGCRIGISPTFREGCIAFVKRPDLDPERDDQGHAVGASVTDSN
jgi:hypothetical protein